MLPRRLPSVPRKDYKTWQQAYFYEQVGDEQLPLIKDRCRAGYLVGDTTAHSVPPHSVEGSWVNLSEQIP